MDGYLRALFDYAQEEGVAPCLESRNYRRAAYGLEEGWEAFRSALTAEQARRLDALLDRERSVGYLTEEAVFRCGLSAGVELGRL